MTAIDEIKTAIMSLTNNHFHTLRAWIEEYSEASKLDKLAAEAIGDSWA